MDIFKKLHKEHEEVAGLISTLERKGRDERTFEALRTQLRRPSDHLELHIEGEGPAHIVSCDWGEWSPIAFDDAPSFVLEAIKGSEL